MLCKITAKNQITLPKDLLSRLEVGEYLDARIEEGRIILEPIVVRPAVDPRLAAIRLKVAAAGIREKDLPQLIDEARRADRL